MKPTKITATVTYTVVVTIIVDADKSPFDELPLDEAITDLKNKIRDEADCILSEGGVCPVISNSTEDCLND